LTGSSGNLASAIIPLLQKRGDTIIGADTAPPSIEGIVHQNLDITDGKRVIEVMEKHKPDLVIHLAAETNVDRCQIEPERAHRINASGTSNLALACKGLGASMVYLSTGEIFDGDKLTPYVETDQPNPVNVYAQSKLDGEIAVRAALTKYFIVRSGWLFGGGGKDAKFVGKIIKILETAQEVKAVDNIFGSPTYINDLASNILRLVDSGKYGLYHMCNKGFVSRYDMARKIVEVLEKKEVKVVPVSSEVFPMPAKRGRSEVLENHNLMIAGLDFMPSWDDALKRYLRSFPQKPIEPHITEKI